MNFRELFAWTALAAASLACNGKPAPAAASTERKSAVVDSAVPREVAIERFQKDLPRVDSLIGGAPSREALVRRFVAALESSDTAAVRTLAISRAEFAWLYYPTAAQGLPPYDLSPSLLWFLTDERSAIGVSRALRTYGGRPLGYRRVECDPKPAVEGENRVWGPCQVVMRGSTGTTRERLFGLIVERRSRFKFLSYGNKLD